MLRRVVASAFVAYVLALTANRTQVVVRGASMEPTLWPGDRLITVPAPARLLRAGQVVVVADPADPDHRVVKRLHHVADGTVDVRGDAPDRSTDSRTWGRLPVSSVRRIAVARWPDVRTPLRRSPPELGQPAGPTPRPLGPTPEPAGPTPPDGTSGR